MPSRTWIKIYCDKWLSGTLRQETSEFRGIWADLLALAGSGRYGDVGEIKLADNVPLTDAQFAGILNISPETWLTTKERCLQTDRIRCNGAGIIQIVNWGKYQSEYERQKPYRVTGKSYKHELQPTVTSAGDKAKCVEKEKEKERGGEGKEEQSSSFPPPSVVPPPIGKQEKQCNGILSHFTEAQQGDLRTKFPGLDLDFEAGKCEAWWAEGKRELKRPKLALMNWLQKAVKGHSRPGAPRESHEYTRPEEAD